VVVAQPLRHSGMGLQHAQGELEAAVVAVGRRRAEKVGRDLSDHTVFDRAPPVGAQIDQQVARLGPRHLQPADAPGAIEIVDLQAPVVEQVIVETPGRSGH